MRILVLADQLIMGGLETHIITFTNELLRRGHQILLYTAHTEPAILAQIHDLKNNFSHVDWSDNAEQKVIDFAPEIVHAHPFSAIMKGYQLAQNLQVPLIITMHGLYDFGIDKSPLGNQISGYARTIIAVDYAVADLLKKCTAHPEKIMVIPNGIDVTFFSPLTQKRSERVIYGVNPNWYTMTVISRFDDGKEQPILQLLRSSPELAKYHKGLNLVIVGDGSQFKKLNELAVSINENHQDLKISLVGKQSDVRPFIKIADLVLACDRAALEAMACGRRVFAMNHQGFGGIIDQVNYQTLLLYRRGYRKISDDMLVAALLSLIKYSKKKNPLSKMNCEIIHQNFNIAEVTSQLESIYIQSVSQGELQ